MTIDVTPTNNGWIITQGANRTEVTDSNGNGKLDDGDLAQIISGNSIAQNDMVRIANTVNGTDQNNPNTQNTKKKGFWGTVGSIFSGIGSVVGGVMSGVMGMFGFGMGQDAWSRNTFGGVGFNDMKVGINSMQPGVFNMGVNNMLGSMGYNPMSTMNMGGGMDFSAIMASVNQYMQQTNNNLSELESSAVQKTEEKYFDDAQKLLDSFNEKPETITDANKKKYEEALERAKSNNNKLTDEDKTMLQKINNTPLVNENLIQNSADEKNKLPITTAVKINSLLKKYNEAADDKKDSILSAENHEKLTAILAKSTLEESDINEINEIVK